MKYLVRVVVPFGLHRKNDQLNVDLDFMEKFGRYTKVIAEIEDPEEAVQSPPKRKQKKSEPVDVELPFEGPVDGTSGDLQDQG